MKISKLASAAVIATVGLVSSGHAAVTTNFGDLIMGFRTPNTTAGNAAVGGSGALTIDLGSASFYSSQAAGSIFQVASFSPTDLVDTYGASWNTRTDLTFGIVGANDNNDALQTVWASNDRVDTTPGIQSVAQQNSSGQANLRASTFQTQITALNGQTSTANNTQASFVPLTNSLNWKTKIGSNGQFGTTFAGGGSIEQDTNLADNVASADGNVYALLDVYQLTNDTTTVPGTVIGQFGLRGDGTLWFSNNGFAAAAIPEPSTYAAILGALALGAVAIRRRKQAAAVEVA